jgi:hypothetical protein
MNMLLKVSRLKLALFVAALMSILYSTAAQSPFNIIYTDASGRYVYVSDFLGNHILDYSHAGYMGGNEPIPGIEGLPAFPVSIVPGTTDYTASIQQAIDNAAANYANTGMLSVVQLEAGNYPIVVPESPGANLLIIPGSGVILAGAGSGSTTITVNGTTPVPSGTNLVVIGAGNNGSSTDSWAAPGAPTAQIANIYIPAGSTEFRVTPAAANGYIPQVGDNMIIDVPTKNYWSSFTNYGGIGSGTTLPPNTSAQWWGTGTIGPINSTYNSTYSTTDLADLRYNRTVTAVANLGNNTYGVSVDTPIYAAINNGNPSPTGQAVDVLPYVYPFDANATGYINNVGVQGLTISIGFSTANGGTATYNELQEYATMGIHITQANNAWVDDVIVSGYRTNAIAMRSVTQATISNSQALNVNTYFVNAPSFDGGFGFFMQNACSNILINNCFAEGPSHGFAQNSPTTSGIVVLNSSTNNNYLASGGHKKWAQGILFDHLNITNDIGRWASAAFNNRFVAGTSQGWSSVNSVMWGFNPDQTAIAVVQQPPQGQNYFMSYTQGQPSGAVITGQGLCNGNPCTQPSGNPGYFETNNSLSNADLPSLYQTQLAERQTVGGLPPSAPASLTVSFDSNKATLSWDTLMGAGQGVKNFAVERSNDGGQTFTLLTAAVAPTATSYVDSTSGVSINSLYRIYALNDINTNTVRSAYSNMAPVVARYVKLVMYTSINSLNGGNVNLNDFKVYSKSSGSSPVSPKAVYVYDDSNNTYTMTNLPASCFRNRVGCAFDRSTSSYFATFASPWINVNPSTNQQNLYVDLTGTNNSVLSLSNIALTFSNPFSPEYYIYVSADGVNWTQVYGTIFGTTGLNTITF